MSILTLFIGARAPLEFQAGQTVALSRSLLAPSDLNFSQSHAPEIGFDHGRWWLRNRYATVGTLPQRIVVRHNGGHIVRVSPGEAAALSSETVEVHISGLPVGIEITDSVPTDPTQMKPTVPAAEFTTLAQPTMPSAEVVSSDAVVRVREHLEQNEANKLATVARYQEFLNVTIANPKPLTAEESAKCATMVKVSVANYAAKMLRQFTGLIAGVELGDWLTREKLLVESDAASVPHDGCAHHGG